MKKRTLVAPETEYEEMESVDATGGSDVVDMGPSEDMYAKVKLKIPIRINVNGVDLPPGENIVERHQVESIVEMIDKKRRADASVFTGNNYLVNRLADNTLVIKKVDKI